MYAKGIAVVALGLALAGCGNDEPKWIKPAVDNEVDQQRWQSLKPDAKVATAGLWLGRQMEQGMLSFDKPIADMEPEAEELADCIDEALSGSIGLNAERVQYYSSGCVHRLGFAK